MAFDPFLYLAFALGFGVGRVVRAPAAWVRPALFAAVVLLVGLLGASLDSVGAVALLAIVPVALGFAGLILSVTAVVYLLLARRASTSSPPPSDQRAHVSVLTSFGLLGALLIGLLVGRSAHLPINNLIEWTLYALVALVALGVHFPRNTLRRAVVPMAAATAGGLLAAGVAVAIGHLPLSAALATCLAFGWYSLAGPVVAAHAGAVLGLLAFLTNYLREALTMLFAPIVGRRLHAEGLTALGGATSMDTTLFFVTRFGGTDGGGMAVASGLALTVTASLVVPLVLAL